MNILFIVFVSATYVLCHPVSDPEILGKGIQARDASENDISLKRNEGTVIDDETPKTPLPNTSEANTISIWNNLDDKGIKIIQDIITKIANGMKINETDNAEKSENNSEKLLKSVVPVITEIQNENNAPEVPTFNYINGEYMLSNQNPSKVVDANVENPNESVFHIVPFGIEKPESMLNLPKLNRNFNKLENENIQDPLAEQVTKAPNKEGKVVEVPLDVQTPNQEDHYLPDLDIPETILNNPSLSNPLLSPYDTLPLNIFPPEAISADDDKTMGEKLNPYLRQEVAEPVSQDAEFQNSEDNFIHSDVEKDVPADYDDVTYQDYYPSDKMPMIDNYDYDFNGRNLHVPSYNQMPMMNSYYRNNAPFEQSMNMGSNYPSRLTSFPRNELSTIIYSNPEASPMRVNPNNILQNLSDDEVSLLMERIFPGIFKKNYPQNSKKDIALYIDGTYPGFTTKENKPFIQNEMKLNEIKTSYEKKPQDFIMEIGNMNPMAENHYNPLQRTEQDDYDKHSFEIKPVIEDFYNEITSEKEYFNAQSDMNEEMANQPIFDMPDNNPYYGYRTYAPQYYHALYMSPGAYSFHYPNRQYMPKPLYNEFPEPMYNNYKMGPHGYVYNRNPTPYFSVPMLGTQMNLPYSYPSNPYDYNVRNTDWRFYNPNQYIFAPTSYDRYPVPTY